LVVCHGSDPSLVARAVAAELADVDRLGVTRLDRDATAAVVTEQVSARSLFSADRVVVVDDVTVLAADTLDAFRAFAGSSPVGVRVVAGAVTARAPAGLVKNLDPSVCRVVDVNPPRKASETVAWVSSVFAEAGVALTPAAVRLVADRMGAEPNRVAPLAELVAAAGVPGPVPVDVVADLAGAAGDTVPWALTDAIGAGDTIAALGAQHRMLAAGRHPLAVLAVVRKHVEARWRIAAVGGRLDDAAVASLTGLRGFPAAKAARDARRRSVDAWEGDLVLVAAADGDLKGRSALPAGVVLDVLVARLAARNA
jgi:DNA polymerase III delta subunit